tara:strand:+ start:537 stop:659 length:123 start_codon:yes stop_codon:yes gene_type:complete
MNLNNKSTVVMLPSWWAQDIEPLKVWKKSELKYKVLRRYE